MKWSDLLKTLFFAQPPCIVTGLIYVKSDAVTSFSPGQLLGKLTPLDALPGMAGGLALVDVVVGMDRCLRSELAPQQLNGPVGDDLVNVHVFSLGAAARR